MKSRRLYIGSAIVLEIANLVKPVVLAEEYSSIIDEKDLFEKIDQKDDSIISTLEQIFATKKK